MRDTATLCFARHGFGTSVRTIASDAGVSPALVIHRFGSKQALRDECDGEILARIRTSKRQTLAAVTSGQSILHRLAEVDEAARARYLTLSALGALLLEIQRDPAGSPPPRPSRRRGPRHGTGRGRHPPGLPRRSKNSSCGTTARPADGWWPLLLRIAAIGVLWRSAPCSSPGATSTAR
ncbi:MAG: TetR family transcriptional regulator [Aeromicrobium sp.]|uniref:TetR/AcrR family transcriptional regulator n=1 Tax=Aeromicrobium sp. TaxID=1871063 RepID=UPI0039E70DC4